MSYQSEWLKRRRDLWIEKNGPCKSCGSLENLQIDHIDPTEKKYHPSRLWSRRKEVRDKELAKCQVLCKSCHSKKTKKDLSKIFTGKQVLKTRSVTNNSLMNVLALIKLGMSERKACSIVGISRGTFSSIKVRGYRSEIFIPG